MVNMAQEFDMEGPQGLFFLFAKVTCYFMKYYNQGGFNYVRSNYDRDHSGVGV